MTDLRWQVDLGKDGTQVVEIPALPSGPSWVFRCDRAEYSLGGSFHSGPRVASFAIAGHPATMTLTFAEPGFRDRLRRSLGAGARRLPMVLVDALAGALAGNPRAGRVAGSMAGYDAAVATRLVWRIYQLTVDGSSRGAQVARVVGGKLESWTRVAPGGSLPDGSNWFWPDVRK